MIETRMVSGRRAASSDSALTLPSGLTGRYVASKPSFFTRYSQQWRTAWCSIAELIMCRPLWRSSRATPKTARLALSVPPLVNTTSLGLLPHKLATRSRPSPDMMDARWIAKNLVEIRQHRVPHGCIERCRGVIVEINRLHTHSDRVVV